MSQSSVRWSSLGEELRKARETVGWTQEELGSKVRVDRSYISQLERGLKSPTLDMLLRLCKAMSVSASEIVARVEREAAQDDAVG